MQPKLNARTFDTDSVYRHEWRLANIEKAAGHPVRKEAEQRMAQARAAKEESIPLSQRVLHLRRKADQHAGRTWSTTMR